MTIQYIGYFICSIIDGFDANSSIVHSFKLIITIEFKQHLKQ